MSTWGWNDSSEAVDNPNNDVIIKDPPKGSISSVRCSPTRDMIAVGSWDSHVRIYEHDNNGNTRCLGSKKHDKPVLCVCWDELGQHVFSAGCDNTVQIWNLQKQSFQALGNYHKAAISDICFVKEKNVVITGSWDGSIVFWDLRTSQRGLTMDDIKAKVFNMAYKDTMLACALSNRHLRWYDVRNPRSANDSESAFKTQLRGLDCFPNGGGFAVGSVEGRIQVYYGDKRLQEQKGFSFKCHRQELKSTFSYSNTNKTDTHVYSVNTLRFHQQIGTLASGGSDGEISIWDKDGRARLKHLNLMKSPIVALDFNRSGQILVYGTSYDYSKGHDANLLEKEKPRLYMHRLQREDVDPKAPKSSNS